MIHNIVVHAPTPEALEEWRRSVETYLDEISELRGTMGTLNYIQTGDLTIATIYLQTTRRDAVSGMVTPISAPRKDVEEALAKLRSAKKRIIDPA